MKNKINEWQKLREEGLTFKQIAEQYNVSRQAIWEALNKKGLIESKTKHSKHHKDWEVLYNYGINIKDIAKKYNAPYQTVNYYLKTRIKRSNSTEK